MELTILRREKKIPEEKMYSVHQILGMGVMRGMLRLSSHGRLPGEIGAVGVGKSKSRRAGGGGRSHAGGRCGTVKYMRVVAVLWGRVQGKRNLGC